MENNAFTHWWGNAIDVVMSGSGTALTRITNNVAASASGALAASGGIRVGGGEHRYLIQGNTVIGSNGTAISADRTGVGALMSGSIENNVIGDPAQPGSGTYFGTDIYAGAASGTTMGIVMGLGATSGDRDVACFDIGGPGALANTFDDEGASCASTSTSASTPPPTTQATPARGLAPVRSTTWRPTCSRATVAAT